MIKKRITILVAAMALATGLALGACGESKPAADGSANAPAESVPAESAPTESESTESAPAESAPAESAPAESAPAASAPAESAPAASAPAPSASEYIGEDAAIDIALKDAGFTVNDVIKLEAELDLDDAIIHYDVEFKQGGMEYDYDIDAVTGAILNAHSEVDD